MDDQADPRCADHEYLGNLDRKKKLEQSKPNIEDVYSAFINFQKDLISIFQNFRPGRWDSEMKEARSRLKFKLKALGLAEHIDWTDKE